LAVAFFGEVAYTDNVKRLTTDCIDHPLEKGENMEDKTQRQPQESLKNEYSEANQNFRHFSSLRFAVFSVFFAIEAGLANAAFNADGTFTSDAINYAKVGAILITLVFWSYQERIAQLITHFMKITAELEKKLNYTQVSSRPPARFPSFDLNTITRIFFPLLIAFWIYTLLA
jgi:hypothetical protein